MLEKKLLFFSFENLDVDSSLVPAEESDEESVAEPGGEPVAESGGEPVEESDGEPVAEFVENGLLSWVMKF